MVTEPALRRLQEATVWDAEQTKLGTVANVLLAAGTSEAEWITVPLGLFETRAKFIPLAGARQDGTDVYVAFSRDTVKGAPDFDPESELTAEQAAELRSYYGIS